MFADDLKIFKPVKNISLASSLQRDLDILTSWCRINDLELNISKCKYMNFHRKAFSILFQYCIDGTPTDRVTEIKVLGVTFDEKISFIRHIDYDNLKGIFNARFSYKSLQRL